MKWASLSWLDARYEISDTGIVRSWANSHGGVRKEPKYLKPRITPNGYAEVVFTVDKKLKHFLIHRLIMQAFTGTTPIQVNHINGVKTDNRLCNLEKSNASHNAKHAYRVLGRVGRGGMRGIKGKENPHSIRVVQVTLDGRVIKIWDAISDAARHGFGAGNIWAVCVGRRKTHGGFTWRYL